MTEFQEKLRQQHEESLHRELEALLSTADRADAQVRTCDAQKVGQDWFMHPTNPDSLADVLGSGRFHPNTNICEVQEVVPLS